MKNFIYLLVVLFVSEIGLAQALSSNRFYPNKSILDLTNSPPSFAFSLRKLKKTYSGFAIKIRRNTDNAEANVSFDANGIVSSTSNVIVTAVGTSGFTIGDTMSYTTFIALQTILVTTWYDQGLNNYNATQTTTTAQPEIQLNTAGASNNLPSLIFDGNRNLVVNQPIQNLVSNGIIGTFMLVTKPTANTNQLSFGTATGNRWSLHLNWNDNNCYFDAADINFANPRSFANNANIGFYKQYTFIRGVLYKTAKINSSTTAINNSTTTDTAQTGGTFGIGNWDSGTSAGYLGNVSEVIMFNKDYSQVMIKFLETNQINFWLN